MIGIHVAFEGPSQVCRVGLVIQQIACAGRLLAADALDLQTFLFCFCSDFGGEWVVGAREVVNEDKLPLAVVLLERVGVQGVCIVFILIPFFSVAVAFWCFPNWLLSHSPLSPLLLRRWSSGAFVTFVFGTTRHVSSFFCGQERLGCPGLSQMVQRCNRFTGEAHCCPGGKVPQGPVPLFHP